jgi:uncharacterized membrane protein
MPSDVGPVSLRRLWVTALLASAVGIALSAELTVVHARVHANPATRSFCTLSEHISCDRTAQSGYSLFAGIPLSLWGVFAYTLLLLLALWGLRTRRPLVVAPFAIIAAGCAAASLVLAYVSSVMLRNLCLLCLATWIVDWTLFVSAWLLTKRVGVPELHRQVRQLWRSRRALVLVALAGVGCAVLGMRLVVPEAWGKGRVSRVIPGTKLTANANRLSPGIRLPSGLDDAGHPYIGSANPRLSITEFADYQCPHCANAHIEMRELVAKNPATVRIVHRHFPLDNRCNSLVQRPFHTRACDYARLAACALLVGKFWDANDYLFDHGRDQEPVTAPSLARALNIDATSLQECAYKVGAEIVKQDIDEGLQLKVEGTPSFLVDGKVYKGQLPEEMLAPYE